MSVQPKKIARKHMQFVEYLLIEKCNQTEAYMRVYPNVTREVAKVKGSQLLKRPEVQEYYVNRKDEVFADMRMEINELYAIISELARGNGREEVLIGVGGGRQEIGEKRISARDQIEAAKTILKAVEIEAKFENESDTGTVIQIIDTYNAAEGDMVDNMEE